MAYVFEYDVKAASNGYSSELFESGESLVCVSTHFLRSLFYEVANCFLLLHSISRS